MFSMITGLFARVGRTTPAVCFTLMASTAALKKTVFQRFGFERAALGTGDGLFRGRKVAHAPMTVVPGALVTNLSPLNHQGAALYEGDGHLPAGLLVDSRIGRPGDAHPSGPLLLTQALVIADLQGLVLLQGQLDGVALFGPPPVREEALDRGRRGESAAEFRTGHRRL